MKKVWHYLMACAMALTVVSVSNAQSGWNQPSQIGSYQSILNKAGYKTGPTEVPVYGASAYRSDPAPAAQPNAGFGFVSENVAPAATTPVQPGVVSASRDTSCDASGNVGSADCATESCGPDFASTRRGRNFFSKATCKSRNYVIGVSGLVFDRDYEDDAYLSYNPSGGQLLSTDADLGELNGYQLSFASRGSDGRGWEVRYWNFNTGTAYGWLNGNYVTTRLSGLAYLDDPYSMQTVQQTFNWGESHLVSRSNTMSNIELNFMRNGGTFQTRRCKSAFYELLGGFRWFQFDEAMTYSSDTSVAPYSSRIDYNLNVENTLLGFQLGGRTEICLTNKLRFSGGTRLGVYNNRINGRQGIINNSGSYATINSGAYSGQDYYFQGQKDDISFLGEIECGLIYQLGCNSRFNFGYRVFGLSGIALSANQIPNDFRYVPEIRDINSNGSLMMHGAYFGVERSF